MSENTNLVKRWAENIKADADTAIQELLKNSFTYDNQRRVLAAVSEIKGSCEAIISAMDGGKKETARLYHSADHSCNTCRYNNMMSAFGHCDSCVNGGGMVDMWGAQ